MFDLASISVLNAGELLRTHFQISLMRLLLLSACALLAFAQGANEDAPAFGIGKGIGLGPQAEDNGPDAPPAQLLGIKFGPQDSEDSSPAVKEDALGNLKIAEMPWVQPRSDGVEVVDDPAASSDSGDANDQAPNLTIDGDAAANGA